MSWSLASDKRNASLRLNAKRIHQPVVCLSISSMVSLGYWPALALKAVVISPSPRFSSYQKAGVPELSLFQPSLAFLFVDPPGD